jgi:hypothetical protein
MVYLKKSPQSPVGVRITWYAIVMSVSYHPPPSPSRQGRGVPKTLSPGGRGRGEGEAPARAHTLFNACAPIPPLAKGGNALTSPLL